MGLTEKSEFRNTRDYYIGVVVKREDGKMKGMALQPGETVLMDEQEQMATANAPRQESDNPFTNGDLELVQSARALANRRPIGDSKHTEQAVGGQVASGAPPAAEPEAVGGDVADDEEGGPAGSPDAELKGDDPAPTEAPSKKDQEASARAAAARGRAPAANEKVTPPPAPPKAPGVSHTGAAPTPKGTPVEGKAAPAEEVATPEAVGKE